MNRILLLLIAFTACASAAVLAQTTPRVARDISYAEPRNERQLLDVYAPPTGSSLPVVVWVHGGGWMRGS
ncbi:MAG: carboxylesterase family protein, partial [Bryobacteraceae bacterium]|nr:carboxylesterase family protein [Bryobacteraceae bacterium]